METDKSEKRNIRSYLTFKIGGETYATDVTHVLNIEECPRITKIPGTHNYFLGVINVWGYVLPLIDARLKLGIEIPERTADPFVLVLDIDIDDKLAQIGMLVDTVEEVIMIKQEQIQLPPAIGNHIRTELIEGMYKNTNEEFIMLLNLNKIFTTDVLDHVLRQQVVNSTT